MNVKPEVAIQMWGPPVWCLPSTQSISASLLSLYKRDLYTYEDAETPLVIRRVGTAHRGLVNGVGVTVGDIDVDDGGVCDHVDVLGDLEVTVLEGTVGDEM